MKTCVLYPKFIFEAVIWGISWFVTCFFGCSLNLESLPSTFAENRAGDLDCTSVRYFIIFYNNSNVIFIVITLFNTIFVLCLQVR